jgi:YfiH family protein
MLTGIDHEHYLVADWPGCPAGVSAVTTLRNGGVSKGHYAAFNLASHVGDEPEAVIINRKKLALDLALPSAPVWLSQVHGCRVLTLDSQHSAPDAAPGPAEADASVTRSKGRVCVVLTADCLPVFFCNEAGTEVAVAHAGWRGLHAGIISETVRSMSSPASQVLVHLGPAIGPAAFEVGQDVYDAFVGRAEANQRAFVRQPGSDAKYLCDIYELARLECATLGIERVSGGTCCTYTDPEHFYSYRRQPSCGRMASLIWLNED